MSARSGATGRRSSPARPGLVGGWLVRRLARRRAPTSSASCATGCPQSELVRGGLLEQREGRPRRRARSGAAGARARRVRDRHRHPPRRADASSAIANRNPVSTFETQHRRHLGAARSLPPQPDGASRSWSRRPTRPTATQRQLPYDEETPLAGPAPLRRQQVVRRPDRAEPTPTTYGLPVGDHALRQLLRRRRPELEPHRARHDPLGAARRSGRSSAPTAQFVRDYFYVEDGAAAYMLLAEQLAARPGAARRGVQLLERDAGHGAASWSSRSSR